MEWVGLSTVLGPERSEIVGHLQGIVVLFGLGSFFVCTMTTNSVYLQHLPF